MFVLYSDSRLCNCLYPPCWLVGGSSPSDLGFYFHSIVFIIIKEWWIPLLVIRKWRFVISWKFGELHSCLRLEPGMVVWDKNYLKGKDGTVLTHPSQFCYKTSGKFVPSRHMEKSWQDNRKQTHPKARAPLLQACWFRLSYGVEFTELNVGNLQSELVIWGLCTDNVGR